MWKQAELVPIVWWYVHAVSVHTDWVRARLVPIPSDEVTERQVAQWEDMAWGEAAMVSDHFDHELEEMEG